MLGISSGLELQNIAYSKKNCKQMTMPLNLIQGHCSFKGGWEICYDLRLRNSPRPVRPSPNNARLIGSGTAVTENVTEALLWNP